MNKSLSNAINLYMKSCKKELKHLRICDYKYKLEDVAQEIGLEKDFLENLVEDFVIQIIDSKAIFIQHLQELERLKEENLELDFTPLRELTHRNLGVARNLSISNCEKILHEIMHNEDLVYLHLCVNALEASAIKLKPTSAYKILKEQ